MKGFLFDVILDEENICNLKDDREKIYKSVSNGERIVFTGRRNTGKTSIIKSVILPKYKKSFPDSLVVFADLMGVRSLDDIANRISKSLEQTLSEGKPSQVFLQGIAKVFRSIRPVMNFDQLTGLPSVSLELANHQKSLNLEGLIEEIGRLHKKHGCLLVFDEFQDVSFVNQAEGILRNALQNLSASMPIILMGSKKHLLTKIFTSPNAPFAGWGKYHEISLISTKHYLEYINDRFKNHGLSIDSDGVQLLQDELQNIPECINIVCDKIQRSFNKKTKITKIHINIAISETLKERQGFYEERLSFFSGKEMIFLEALAKGAPIKQISSREFLSKIKMSTGSLTPMIKRLENQAVIYKTNDGYVMGDPLMGYYPKTMR